MVLPKYTVRGLELTDPSNGNMHNRVTKLVLTRNLPFLHDILHDTIKDGLLEDYGEPYSEGMRTSELIGLISHI